MRATRGLASDAGILTSDLLTPDFHPHRIKAQPCLLSRGWHGGGYGTASDSSLNCGLGLRLAIIPGDLERAGADVDTEFAEALTQVYRIAWFRLEAAIKAPEEDSP